MRKLMLVAAISLTVGGLIGTYAGLGRADAAAAGSCSRPSIVRFMTTTLGRGAVAQVPPGCTDALLLQLYLQVYRLSEQTQTLNSSVTTLDGRLIRLCQQLRLTC
jgi:hypothetical protein